MKISRVFGAFANDLFMDLAFGRNINDNIALDFGLATQTATFL